MIVRILGAAAGGGLPQWNCGCPNCRAVRAGSPHVRPRTQSSVAVTGNGRHWFLLNASADVRQQVLAWDRDWPSERPVRSTLIAGCLLTDAEIDHVSGLLQLREGCEFAIYSTPPVHRWLSQVLPFQGILEAFASRPWRDLPWGQPVTLTSADGELVDLEVEIFAVGDHAPRYVPGDSGSRIGATVGLLIRQTSLGASLCYAPCVAGWTEGLRGAAAQASCVLLDGTFWANNELLRLNISSLTALEMGHLPVSGSEGTLDWLATLPASHRAYVHINNTNPMLDQTRPEHWAVLERGIRVACDGDTIELT